MANMTLTLDVVSNVNYSKIEEEVNNIRDRLSKIPDKIKIDIDVAMAKNAARAIEDIQSGIEGVVRSAGATSKMSGVTKGFDDAAKSATTMGSALRDQVDAITGVTRETHKGATTAAEWNMLLRQQADEAKNAAEANRLLAESEAQKQAAAQSTTTALQEQINAITGVTRETHNGATTASEWNMLLRMQAEEAKAAADQTKALEQAQRKAATAQKSSAAALSSGEKSLRNWTQAQHSSNEESRNAYANLQNAVNALRTARQNYDGSAASVANLEAATQNLNNVQKETEGILTRNGDASRTLGERFTELASKFTSWLTVSQAVMLAIRSIKKMASEAIAVDDAMTQLRIVTNETDATYQRFGENVAKTAQKIGASMTDIIDATTTFARLGYSLNESSALAEMTTMLQKVGDIEARDAQSAITSIIKAFDIDVADMESVMDKLVTVGNNFPISVSEIAEGMMNASSALAAAGNSFDKSVALLAAANTTIQDAAKASTGLRTITARLQKTDTELDELGEAMTESAYADLVGALTKHNVALQDANGEYRDTYDILQDIAAIWDTMSTTEQAALAELVAGNRQRNVFSSIISNFDVASGAMQEMQRSAGALKESYDEWLNSASAHIETFKAAFQGLATDFFSGDFIATFVDIGTAIINIIDGIVKLTNHVGGLKTVLMGVAGVVAVIKADAIVAGIISIHTKLTSFVSLIASVPSKISAFASAFRKVNSAFNGTAPLTTKIAAGFNEIGISASAAQVAVGGFVAAIGAIMAVSSIIDSAERSKREALEESFNNSMSGQAEIDNLYQLYQQYLNANEAVDGSAKSKEALAAATRDLCNALGIEASEIDNVTGKLKQMTIDEAEHAVVTAQKMLAGIMDTFRDSTEKGTIGMWALASGIDISSNLPAAERAKNLVAVYDILIAKRQELIDSKETDTVGYDNIDSAINLLAPSVRSLTDAQNYLNDATERYNNVLNPAAETVEDTATATEKAASNLKDSSDNTLKAIENIEKAQKMLNSQEAGKSISLADFTAEGMEDYTSALEYVNGVYQISAEKINAIVQAKTAEQIAVNEANKAYAQQQYLENAKRIEKYRRELELAKDRCDGTEVAIQANIDSLIAENSALRSDCAQYDLMSAALAEATSAYQNWLNAKNAGQTGDMFDGALAAIKQMNDVLNNTNSDMYGRVGRTDYKAAVDFIVPDTIDHEDAAAVNAYMQSISDMFTFDDKGNQTGLNIGNFIQKSLDAGLIVANEAGDAYEVAGGKTMEDFARGLGLSLPLVRAMFGELQEFGATFDWSDEANQGFGDLGISASQATEALRELEEYKDINIVIDVSDFEDKQKAIETLNSTIDALIEKRKKLNKDNPDDIEEYNNLTKIIDYNIAQTQRLGAPDIMRVDTSSMNDSLGKTISLLQKYQTAKWKLEKANKTGSDASGIEEEIQQILQEIAASSDVENTLHLGVTVDSNDMASAVDSAIANLDTDKMISLGVDTGLIQKDISGTTFEALGTVTWDNKGIPSHIYRTGTITWENSVAYVTIKDQNGKTVSSGGSGVMNGTANVNGTAFANGSALARGNWGTKSSMDALVGELGQELIVDPNTGRWYTIGDNGAEFRHIPEGAIVFNHKQTESLFKYGKVAGRGKSHVNGSANDGNALVTGYIPGDLGSFGYNGYGSSGSSAGSGDANGKDGDKKVDWIEVAISRIERLITKISKIASSALKKLDTKLKATGDQIKAISEEIEIQTQGARRYYEEADGVKLGDDIKKLVRDGAIDIQNYKKETQELISEYKEWYEKALACEDAVEDLKTQIVELYQTNFDTIQKDFSNRISMMDQDADLYRAKLENMELHGYDASEKYYKSLRSISEANIGVMQNELRGLEEAFSQAMQTGEIDEYSDAWYEMQSAITDVKISIEEATNAIEEYNSSIREIEWSRFDYARESVAKLNDEAEFLVNILSRSDLFDNDGVITDEGAATLGLLAQEYNTYMAQADAYSEEIKRINKDIANDPYNKELISRREDLLDLQRESIIAAADEKDAIKDIVSNGINGQLDALKKLIDEYENAADAAKSLYDYQKQIKSASTEVSKLEKILSVYENGNDMSEENRARVQELRMNLKEANQNLEDTQYTQYIGDQKKLLDDLYDEYSEVINRRLDDIDTLIDGVIESTNASADEINNTITSAAAAVGYSMTDALSDIWGGSSSISSVVAKYGDDFNNHMTTVKYVLNGIERGVIAMAEHSDSIADGSIKQYKTGGLADFTGLAKLDGTASRPEIVLNATDSKNLIALRDLMRNVNFSDFVNNRNTDLFALNPVDVAKTAKVVSAVNPSSGIRDINISIPIEKVVDYEDLVTQMKNDGRFEGMILDMTLGRLSGKSPLAKNKYTW